MKNFKLFLIIFLISKLNSRFELIKNNKRLIAETLGFSILSYAIYKYNLNNNLLTKQNKDLNIENTKNISSLETQLNKINNLENKKKNYEIKNNELTDSLNKIKKNNDEQEIFKKKYIDLEEQFKKVENEIKNLELKNNYLINNKEKEIKNLENQIINLKKAQEENQKIYENLIVEDNSSFINIDEDKYLINELDDIYKEEKIKNINSLQDLSNEIQKLYKEKENLEFEIRSLKKKDTTTMTINKLSLKIKNLKEKNKIGYFLKNNINFFKKKLDEQDLNNNEFVEKYVNILSKKYKDLLKGIIKNPFDLGSDENGETHMFSLNSNLDLHSIYYIKGNKYLYYETLYDMIDQVLLNYNENDVNFNFCVKKLELNFNLIYKELEINDKYKIDKNFYINLFLAFLNKVTNFNNEKFFDFDYLSNEYFKKDEDKIKNYEKEIKDLKKNYDPKDNLLNQEDLNLEQK